MVLKTHVGLNVALTEIKCRNAKPNGTKTKKYFDGGGLCLLVDGKGRKYWRLFYRMPGNKKQQVVSFGAYPKISLKDARLKRDEVKLMIADGIDPKIAAKKMRMRQQVALENTFADVARRWVKETAEVKNWSDGHRKRSKSLLERFFIPRIGDLPTSEIEPMQVLSKSNPYNHAAQFQHRIKHWMQYVRCSPTRWHLACVNTILL